VHIATQTFPRRALKPDILLHVSLNDEVVG
jgi:hypothetical protein